MGKGSKYGMTRLLSIWREELYGGRAERKRQSDEKQND